MSWYIHYLNTAKGYTHYIYQQQSFLYQWQTEAVWFHAPDWKKQLQNADYLRATFSDSLKAIVLLSPPATAVIDL